jgi:ApaG protein
MPAMAQPAFTSTVTVQPLPEQTDPARQIWAYAYTVTIHNSGDTPAQLIAREWQITDHQGRVQQVRGLGVVGHQPLLKPGERFEYTSWAQIGTPQGSMQGSFFCITEDAHWFESPVAEFMLADLSSLH